MAHMIPLTLSKEDYNEYSKENIIWNSLKKNLSDDYYVMHSKVMSYRKSIYGSLKTVFKDSEADFIIINRKLGVVVVEAKNVSSIKVVDGVWTTNEGIEIHHGDGPYKQVTDVVGFLKSFVSEVMPTLKAKLPITHIVWFHTMSKTKLQDFKCIDDANLDHTFSADDLADPSKRIKTLLEHTAVQESKTLDISDSDFERFKQFLNIENNYFDATQNLKDQDRQFERLLDEQIRILDFLEGQNFACIQGLGGTGKTVIAIEKAKRCVLNNEKTLFLCYNSALQKHLAEKYKDIGIDFYTLDSFSSLSRKAMNRSGNINSTYSDITAYVEDDSFPYKNIIVDEGQDFSIGSDNAPVSIEVINNLFDTLKYATEIREGCFYIFFDKYQCVQSNKNLLPNVIKEPECLITLKTNCRNTLDIANTSIAPLKSAYHWDKKIGVLKGLESIKPNCYALKNEDKVIESINKEIESFKKHGLKTITILTLKNLNNTVLDKENLEYDNKDNNYYYRYDGKRYLFTTVRKFKGLEAEGIILLDVDENTFSIQHSNVYDDGLSLFYVGSSRASRMLSIISVIKDTDKLKEVLSNSHGQTGISRPIINLVIMLLKANLKS